MNIYNPVTVVFRLVVYSLLLFAVAEFARLDALYPMEEGYFGEISFLEITQEIILFVLFVLYLIAGRRYKPVQPVTNVMALLFLASFIREFNFLIDWWFYLVLPVLLVAGWLLIRDYKKLGSAIETYFRLPASAWFFAGFLVTFLFSRLMGRSSFWLLLYEEPAYRLAKAGVEEGLELAGDVMMLISAIELFLFIRATNKKRGL